MSQNAHLASRAVPSFDQLPRVLGLGGSVFVVGRTGREVEGRILEVSDASLVLKRGRQTRTFTAEDVRSVAVRGPDPLGNGALIGAIAGGSLAAVPILAGRTL